MDRNSGGRSNSGGRNRVEERRGPELEANRTGNGRWGQNEWANGRRDPVTSLIGRLQSSWTVTVPVVALVVLVLTWQRNLGALAVAAVAVVLVGSILAAVHHAEVIAHRVGEPFGSLVLAVAVTVIEVALIITLMISGGPETASLARDTVFAAVMITANGIVGLALLVGAVRFGTVRFNTEGTGAALGVIAMLATMTLVLPSFTSARSGPEFSPAQLAFAGIASLALYAAFVSTQTVRHRDFFLPVPAHPGRRAAAADDAEEHAPPPSTRAALLSLGLLAVALVAVVGLAKAVSPAIEAGVKAAGIPESFVGVVIALLVLTPEGIAATRAALRDRIQTSLNLGYGSAIASIGLTVPVIALSTLWLEGPLILGLGSTQIVLLTLTVVVSVLTVAPGRATRLQGTVHLILLAAFIFLAINP
ncbi:ionic transporter y4hA [Arthrobacter crusticola]|uniref:Ionic transporter y4hA n=1 Tax=Arthrobacter crusticola TaxID=2547960 RepID=A0A4R5TWY7_9MICC|nr:ionic transporter y4hA [Arthrobacter crusticola]